VNNKETAMSETLARRTLLGAAATVIAAPAPAQAATPETIAVIGTGNVGSSLGKAWAVRGHRIVYGSRTPTGEKVQKLVAETGHGATAATQKEAAAQGGIVLLATPSASTVEIVRSLGTLSGKVLVDATNLLSFKDGKVVEPAECLAEQIAAAAPDANVVKAFNTTNARVMADPAITGGPVTIPLAGASVASKQRVAALAQALGLETVDLGGNDAFRMVEHLGRLYVGYGVVNRPRRIEIHLRPWTM
jgi:hypothetical protein